jgi:hypothetical protein
MKQIIIFLLFSLSLIAQANAAKIHLILGGTVVATFSLPSGYDCDNFRTAPGYGDFLENNGCYNNDSGHTIWCIDGRVTLGGDIGSLVPSNAVLLPIQKTTPCNCVTSKGKTFEVDCPGGDCEECCKKQGGTLTATPTAGEGDCITIKGERRQSPTVNSVNLSSSKVVINATSNVPNMGLEYSLDGVNWQNNNMFTANGRAGAFPIQNMTVYVRYIDGQCQVSYYHQGVITADDKGFLVTDGTGKGGGSVYFARGSGLVQCDCGTGRITTCVGVKDCAECCKLVKKPKPVIIDFEKGLAQPPKEVTSLPTRPIILVGDGYDSVKGIQCTCDNGRTIICYGTKDCSDCCKLTFSDKPVLIDLSVSPK